MDAVDIIQEHLKREFIAKPAPPTAAPVGHYALHNISPNGILDNVNYGVHNSVITTVYFSGYAYTV